MLFHYLAEYSKAVLRSSRIILIRSPRTRKHLFSGYSLDKWASLNILKELSNFCVAQSEPNDLVNNYIPGLSSLLSKMFSIRFFAFAFLTCTHYFQFVKLLLKHFINLYIFSTNMIMWCQKILLCSQTFNTYPSSFTPIF